MMKLNRNAVGICLLVVALSACNDDAPDYEAPPCLNGEFICSGDTLMQCNSGEWEDETDCAVQGLACVDGTCREATPFAWSAQSYPVEDADEINIGFGVGGRYILMPYSANSDAVSEGYSIEFLGPPTPQNEARLMAKKTPMINQADIPRLHQRIAGDAYFRERDRKLWELRRNELQYETTPARKSGGCNSSLECGDRLICEDGICTDAVSLHFDGWAIHTDITADVVLRGDTCAILVDSEDSAKLTETDAEVLLDACQRVVVPRDRFFFGEPIFMVDGEERDLSDRNGDGLVHILASEKVNDENVWGFFNSADFFDDDDPDYPSNERDILYISVPVYDGDIPPLQATIIHEYQHLLHFVNRAYGPTIVAESGRMSPVWLDEAMAHLAEEIGGYGVDNVMLVADYLADFNNTALVTGSDTLKKRAMGMLFMLYLFEQSGGVSYGPGGLTDNGGAAFLQDVLDSESQGAAAVAEAMQRNFSDIFFDWLTTMVVAGRGLTDDPRFDWKPIIADSVTGNPIGVVTYGERDGGYGTSMSLEGPAFEALVGNSHDGIIDGTGVNAIDAQSLNGSKRMAVTGPATGFYLGVIRIE